MGLLILITSLVKSSATPPTSLPASVVTLAPLVGKGSPIFYTDDANSTDASGLLLNESALVRCPCELTHFVPAAEYKASYTNAPLSDGFLLNDSFYGQGGTALRLTDPS